MESIVQMRNITKIYGEGDQKVYALNDVSLDIEEGTFVAIVGKSGSGKSTLLHIMGGLERPNKGEVLIQDMSLYTMKEDPLAICFG